MNLGQNKLKTKQIRFGVLSYDDPKKDLTLILFKSLEKKLNIRLFVINPARKILNYDLDILYFRAGTNTSEQGIAKAIKIYQEIKAKVKIDSLEGLRTANSKSRQYQLASRTKILTPKTIIIKNRDDYKKIELGFPQIIKTPAGSKGEEVFKANSPKEAITIIDKLFKRVNELVIQEFIKMKNPEDIRIYVIGDKCNNLGIIRTARKGEFRANIHQGGTKKYFHPSEKLTNTAIRIAKKMGMEIVSVDFIKYKQKYYLIEINDSFGLTNRRDFNLVKDQKFAEKIINYCLKKLKRKG